MASDTATSPGQAPRRKTLEDIRREIDEEYAPSPGSGRVEPDAEHPRVRDPRGRPDLDEDEVGVERRPGITAERDGAAPGGATSWRRYVTAGAIGCIVGQLLILAYVAVARYGGDILRASSSVSGPRLSAPVLRADDTAALPASIPAAPSAPDAGTPDAGTPDAPPIVADTPGAPLPTTPASLADESKRIEPPPRVVRQRPPSTPPVAPMPRWPLVGPDDWVQSQAQLRSALREWLAMSGRGDGDTHESDAEVILGADGWTAKTRVPTSSRAGVVVIREQRWEHGPNGWNIVDDREIERARR